MSNDPVTRIRNAALEKLKHELAAETAAILAALAVEETGLKTALAAALEVGERLSAARERAPHGLWLPWLRAVFGWTDATTARRYMRVFELSKEPLAKRLMISVW